MNISSILEQLRRERDQLQSAIDALEGLGSEQKPRRGRKPGRHMSADARRRIGLAMKRRWAERKRSEKKTA